MTNQGQLPRVFVDFQNSDRLGRVRLSTVGTIHDLNRLGISLSEGTQLLLYCLELEAQGTATYSAEEGGWVAIIDWGQIQDRPGNK